MNAPTYETGEQQGAPYIRCRLCGKTSYHPEDIAKRYCSGCRHFHHDALFAWFDDSPESGDPACLCSYCEAVIGKPEAELMDDDEIPIRVWTSGDPCLEARFHVRCFKRLTRMGVLTPDRPARDYERRVSLTFSRDGAQP